MTDENEQSIPSRGSHGPAIMSWEQADQIMQDQRAEIARLKEAVRRIAERDATLSVQCGNVVVTMDATLAPKEREAINRAINRCRGNALARKMSGMDCTEDLRDAELLGKLVERLK